MTGHSNKYKEWIYSKQWRQKSNHCLSLTGNRCIVKPWKRATHTHHLTYRNMRNEIPVRDIVALSKEVHMFIHRPFLWKNLKVRKWVNFILRVLMVLQIVWYPIVKLTKKRKK